ncbi:unnamed protein product [Musa acuminata subsp. malaccensis]|nr:unnamed protein product [Musa acuminata subsp. malaccensis]
MLHSIRTPRRSIDWNPSRCTYEKESKEEDKYRLLGKQLAIDASFEPVMAGRPSLLW